MIKIYYILSGASLPISDREIGSQTFCHNAGLNKRKRRKIVKGKSNTSTQESIDPTFKDNINIQGIHYLIISCHMYTNAYLWMKNGALIVSMPTVTRMFGGNGSNNLPKFVLFFMTKVWNSLLNNDACHKILFSNNIKI